MVRSHLAENAGRVSIGMAKHLDLRIRSPEGLVFAGQVVAVRFSCPDGDRAVLSGHAPMMAAICCGALRIVHADGDREAMAIGDGFAQVSGSLVRLSVHFLDFPSRLDRDRAHGAMGRALERLRGTAEDEGWDLVRAEASLCRSMARLSVCGCGCAMCGSVASRGVRRHS